MSDEPRSLKDIKDVADALEGVVRRMDTAEGLTARNIPGLLTYIDSLLERIALLEHIQGCPLCEEHEYICRIGREAVKEAGVRPGFLDDYFGRKYLYKTNHDSKGLD